MCLSVLLSAEPLGLGDSIILCFWELHVSRTSTNLARVISSDESQPVVKSELSALAVQVPRLPMTSTDLARVINSDEIQSVVNAPKKPRQGKKLKKNPLRNLGAMLKLNPYAKTVRRHELANQVRASFACHHVSNLLAISALQNMCGQGKALQAPANLLKHRQSCTAAEHIAGAVNITAAVLKGAVKRSRCLPASSQHDGRLRGGRHPLVQRACQKCCTAQFIHRCFVARYTLYTASCFARCAPLTAWFVAQEGRQKAHAEKLAEIRAGKAKSAKSAETKASGKAFAKAMQADSDYQGEDYEVREPAPSQ